MNYLLGVTGSVASILVQRLIKEFSAIGSMKVVATQTAKRFFKPEFQICNQEVYDDDSEWLMWEDKGEVLHINLRRWANCLVLAPLSANTLAKMANGICDNLLTSTLRAWDTNRPIIIAPAMNTMMWEHPLTQRHLDEIKNIYPNLQIVPPVTKKLACGDYGVGALAQIEDIRKAAEDSLVWKFPLYDASGIPVRKHPGAFAYQRRHDIHSGVDLYCKEGSVVLAAESGRVVLMEAFTGPSDNTPWWNDTKCVMIEGASGCINYGEIQPENWLQIGQNVSRGTVIGRVTPVLPVGKERPDIPGHSRSMLHVELYKHDVRATTEPWTDPEKVPEGLLDPTPFLLNCKNHPCNNTLEMP